MREIRTSGSTRGQWAAAIRRSLSYSTGQFAQAFFIILLN